MEQQALQTSQVFRIITSLGISVGEIENEVSLAFSHRNVFVNEESLVEIEAAFDREASDIV